MTNQIIEKTRTNLTILIDKTIIKTQDFLNRIQIMKKDIDETREYLRKGDTTSYDIKIRKLAEKIKNEITFSEEMIKKIQEMEKTHEELDNKEEQEDKIKKRIKGKEIQLDTLIQFIEINKGDDKTITNNIVGKLLIFKKHKLAIRGYEQGKTLIEGLGSVDVEKLKQTMENYIVTVEGIEIDEVMHMIIETTNEQQLQQYFKNKILKHKNYKAKIYDYKDRKFHLIIRADNKFVHGWVHANKPALDNAVETLSNYSKEHIQQKLERYKPFGIKSLAQLETMPLEERKQKIRQFSQWKGLSDADEETINAAIRLNLKEA